ncbi:serine hydrolase [Streptantibioticus rubrisoli]|uniref:Serine hydrolase n=1 Tax=Streptantibioticus rubrisoli TaxID=1387313 RepID=A0ABT1P8S0_9ACTN|nr:serine hydrolase [Streptantibioticus rubrisoli]MCQ4041206.1 serine hydrolase [Streptantibioticus rubrisoli]
MFARQAALAAVALAAAVGLVAGAAPATTRPPTGRFDQPHRGFAPPWTVLRRGTPEQAGLDPAPIRTALAQEDAWTRPDPGTGHPMFSGQVTLLAHDGLVVADHASGYALRYADRQGDPLPADRQIPMRTDTVFDLASLSKLFTSIVAVQQLQAGRLDLNATVASYLPEFASHGKGAITIEQLLTHTSGLPPDPSPPLWQYPDLPSRTRAILDTTPRNPPGSTYLYSDLNMLTLQQVLQHVTGRPLDTLVRDGITGPLRMRDTMYNPPASLRPRIAAEEYEQGPGEPQRGLVWGQVHDENAWAMGGVAGHAGVFSTVADVAVLAQTILNGGTYRGHRVLSPYWVRQMLTDFNGRFPGDGHGLGFELDQRWYMGRLDSAATAGHTGFTGTTIVIDPESRSIALQFSNRVHPTRDWGSTNRARRAAADSLADAMAVRAPHGVPSWYSGIGDSSAATLTVPMTSRGAALSVRYSTFVDTEPGADQVPLESSTDGGTTWQPVPVTVTGPGAPPGAQAALSGGTRSWWRAAAQLPAKHGMLRLRWRYTTDPSYTGRGVNVCGVRVSDDHGVLFDGDRDPGAFTADGWTLGGR